MESNKLGYWLQVAANIGILAGLILVGLQMQQNNELQKIEHISRAIELDMAHVMAQMGEDPAESIAKAVFEPESMSPKDRVVFTGFMYYMQMVAQRNSVLERYGLFDEEWREVSLPRAAWVIGGNPTGRQWWNNVKAGFLGNAPEWVIELDGRIEKMPEDIHERSWGSYYEQPVQKPATR